MTWEVGDEVELGYANGDNEGVVREVRPDGIVIVWSAYVEPGLRGSDGSQFYPWDQLRWNRWTPRKT